MKLHTSTVHNICIFMFQDINFLIIYWVIADFAYIVIYTFFIISASIHFCAVEGITLFGALHFGGSLVLYGNFLFIFIYNAL